MYAQMAIYIVADHDLNKNFKKYIKITLSDYFSLASLRVEKDEGERGVQR